MKPRTSKRPGTIGRGGKSLLGSFRVGFVPLVDAAPLIVADALGLFARQGVEVKLSAELGWGSIREKIVYGELDAAHAPGALLFSILLGTHARSSGVSTDLILNLQGNAITLSRRWWDRGVRDGRSFRQAVRGPGVGRPVFAVVSHFSSHPFLLRTWLRSAGLDPGNDVRVVVLPPPLVAEHMREGQIDGFCAGEPWNSGAALQGDGWVIATSASLVPRHPEKVLLVRNEILLRQPEPYAALRRAVVEACRFCDQIDKRDQLVDLLMESGYYSVRREDLANSLVGSFQTGVDTLSANLPFHIFHRAEANRASFERAMWCLEGVLETGALTADGRSRKSCLDAFIDDVETPALSTPDRQPIATTNKTRS
jgi:NitT/TauT family transport system ATP-binding protein